MIKKLTKKIADYFLANKTLARIDSNTITPILPWLYRSGQLSTQTKQCLIDLQIHTIINLRFFNRQQDKQQFIDLPIHFINVPLCSWWIRPKQIANILHHIENSKRQGNVLVHCYHGADRTGLIIAFYRIILQNWQINAAKAELFNSPYGYHGIWKNMPHMLNTRTIEHINKLYQRLQNKNK